MSTIWTLLRATAVVAGSSAALLMGGLMGTAHADPAPPPIPAPNIGEQLITSAASAPQVLQNLATALGGTAADAAAVGQRCDQSSAAVDSRSSGQPPPPSRAQPRSFPALPGAAPAATTATPGLGIPGLTPTLPAPTAPASGHRRHPGADADCSGGCRAGDRARGVAAPGAAQLAAAAVPRGAAAAAGFAARRPDLAADRWGPGFSRHQLARIGTRPGRCAGHIAQPVATSRCPACPDRTLAG